LVPAALTGTPRRMRAVTDPVPPAPDVPPVPPAPRYAPPQGYAPPPQWYAPPQGYTPPQGYAPPPQGYGPYTPPPAQRITRGAPGLGVVALVLAVVAAVGTTIIASIAGFSIGLGTGREIVLRPTDIDFDWSILTPVREWVLIGELAFWAGTVLGIWAIVQGIVATAKNRGRGWGIAAIVVAGLGPIVFVICVQIFLGFGFASGASTAG